MIRRPGRSARGTEGRRTGRRFADERGFTLIEVVMAILVLGIVGAAATYLVIRLTSPLDATVRYEQRSLAARMAAEQIWDFFALSPDGPPDKCLPPGDEPPSPEDFEELDVNYAFAFRCDLYEEGGELYRVRVWVQRASDGEMVAAFSMLALVGGY